MKKRRSAQQYDDSEFLQLEAKRSCTQKQPTASNQIYNNNNNFDHTLSTLVSNFDVQCSIGNKPAMLKRSPSNEKQGFQGNQVQQQVQQQSNMFGLLSNLSRIAAETIQEQLSKSVSSIAEIGSAIHQQLPNVALSAQALDPRNAHEWKQSIQATVESGDSLVAGLFKKKPVSPPSTSAPSSKQLQELFFEAPSQGNAIQYAQAESAESSPISLITARPQQQTPLLELSHETLHKTSSSPLANMLGLALRIQTLVSQLLTLAAVWTVTSKDLLLSQVLQLQQFLKEGSFLLAEKTTHTTLQSRLMAIVNQSTIHPYLYVMNLNMLMAHAKTSPRFRSFLYNTSSPSSPTSPLPPVADASASGIYSGEAQATMPAPFNNNSTSFQPHGLGHLKYANGEEYVGDFFNGKRHGLGYFKSNDGSRFMGCWSNDMRHGTGTTWFVDGGIFTGRYENGKRNGFGVYTYKSGNQYYGNWLNGKREQMGFYIFTNGDLYDGSWAADNRNGKGISLYNNGEQLYIGSWLNGIKHGVGEARRKHMTIYTGEFKNGEQSGFGRIENLPLALNNGKSQNPAAAFVPIILETPKYRWYEGQWQANMKSGVGKMLLRTGDLVETEHDANGKLVKSSLAVPSATKRNMHKNLVILQKYTDVICVFTVQ